MKLTDGRIVAADDLISYLLLRVNETGSGNPLRDRYIGFCAVTAATHVETTAKEAILEFCRVQNRYLFAVVEAELKNFNARISYKDLRRFLGRLDPALEDRFQSTLDRLNRRTLAAVARGFDLLQAYQSLLDLRHSFVHNFHVSFAQVTASDLEKYIYASKRVICAFGRTLGE